MSLPFSSGHVLALRVFSRTDFGGYVSIWHRDPDGAWAQYVDHLPVEAGCPRAWGPALREAAAARIEPAWSGPMGLDVTMERPRLRWRLRLEESSVLAVLNRVQGALPLATWRSRWLLAARERVAQALGLGRAAMSGRAPSGADLVAVLRRIYWIRAATAELEGRDLGVPVVLDTCPTIGGWPLARRGVFAIGEAHLTITDPDDHERLRRRCLPGHVRSAGARVRPGD